MFFEQTPAEVILFSMLYGGSALVALVACIYLCLRKGNAFATDVKPPLRLRRWGASFFAVGFLSHVWWLLFIIFSGDLHSVICVVVAVLDHVLLLTTLFGTLLAMLQDRKRPVWPFILGVIPYPVLWGPYIAHPDVYSMYIAITYILLLYVLFSIYMVFAVRQYGRWLRDNYADLEHKEVWASQVLVVVICVFIIIYGFNSGNLTIAYVVQGIGIALFCLLLWRIEILPQLDTISMEQACSPPALATAQGLDLPPIQEKQPLAIPSNIEQLLDEHCVAIKLYLQHDLTILQLAQAVGTNRFYLSQYFSRQNITYNAYINNLRINHFTNLYREAIASGQPITAQQLASDSGYRSYSTFSLAFKQRMGQSVTAWMREMAK